MRILIRDWDTTLFRIALKGQDDTFDYDPNFPIVITDNDYEKMYAECVDSLEEEVFINDCVGYRAYLTGHENYRYTFLPSYKCNRDSSKVPIALKKLKQMCVERLTNCIMKKGEEADDSCTRDFTFEEEGITKILSHVDKDLNQVEGEHFNPDKQEVYFLTAKEAIVNLWVQVLAGDATDCYKGCPMVGGKKPKKGGLSKAEKIILDNMCVKPYTHTFKSGKRKGQSIIKWETYYDRSTTLEQRVLLWYIKGYVTKGGRGYKEGYNTTSGFQEDMKITLVDDINKPYPCEADLDFLKHEIRVQFTMAYMLRRGQSIPMQVFDIGFGKRKELPLKYPRLKRGGIPLYEE